MLILICALVTPFFVLLLFNVGEHVGLVSLLSLACIGTLIAFRGPDLIGLIPHFVSRYLLHQMRIVSQEQLSCSQVVRTVSSLTTGLWLAIGYFVLLVGARGFDSGSLNGSDALALCLWFVYSGFSGYHVWVMYPSFAGSHWLYGGHHVVPTVLGAGYLAYVVGETYLDSAAGARFCGAVIALQTLLHYAEDLKQNKYLGIPVLTPAPFSRARLLHVKIGHRLIALVDKKAVSRQFCWETTQLLKRVREGVTNEDGVAAIMRRELGALRKGEGDDIMLA